MLNSPKFQNLIKAFSELYWLKPMDIIWDAVTAYYIQDWIGEDDVLMDLGCGDGFFSALMFGGRLPLIYDRFLKAIPSCQKIKTNQSGDIYRNQRQISGLQIMPWRKIDFGLELKQHHIRVAESLGVYKKIIKGDFEKIDAGERSIDKAYSVFAFYWGDNLDRQIKEVYRILREKGEFIVILPSEHLFNMHICKRLADEEKNRKVKSYFESLDGGRRDLSTRYARSEKGWSLWFKNNNFKVMETTPVINKIVFIQQDISQRVFLPMLFKMADSNDFKKSRTKVKKYICEKLYPSLLKELLFYESDKNIEHAYYLFRVKKA